MILGMGHDTVLVLEWCTVCKAAGGAVCDRRAYKLPFEGRAARAAGRQVTRARARAAGEVTSARPRARGGLPDDRPRRLGPAHAGAARYLFRLRDRTD